jgi:hypothetical protein
MHAGIKSNLISGTTCYHSVVNLLSFRLLCMNIKIKIHRIVILPVHLFGCLTWFLILRKDVSLKIFDIGRLRKILGPEGEEVI